MLKTPAMNLYGLNDIGLEEIASFIGSFQQPLPRPRELDFIDRIIALTDQLLASNSLWHQTRYGL